MERDESFELGDFIRAFMKEAEQIIRRNIEKRYRALNEKKYSVTMSLTRKQVIENIEFAVEEGRMEDAVLCVVYQLSYGSDQKVGEHAILKRLNQYLKKPFTMDDLQISLALLKQRGLIAE